jgi:hypothetical protein
VTPSYRIQPGGEDGGHREGAHIGKGRLTATTSAPDPVPEVPL